MTKVLRIIGRLNVGGPAIHTVLLTQLLDPARYQSLLVTGVEGPTEGSMSYLAEERGVTPLIIPEMGREISWRCDGVALRKLTALVRRERPGIIHTHTAKAGTLGRLAALAALPRRGRKVFHTFHGHVFHSYFGARKTRAFIRIERALARVTDRLIAVSPTTRDELLGYEIAAPEKISVIPLGLDLEPFAECGAHRGELRRELGLNEETKLVGTVARLVPVKAIDQFLLAAAQVAKTREDVAFVVVGDGELKPALEEQAASLNLAGRLTFLGYRKDLPRIYADLDIVTLSSLNEGLPVSLIEAMASGSTVISSAVGGVPDLIEEGETGFLAPKQNVEALAAAINSALSSPARCAVMAAKAKSKAVSRFHIRRLVSDIDALYSA